MWGYENFEFKHAADEAGFFVVCRLIYRIRRRFFFFQEKDFFGRQKRGE